MNDRIKDNYFVFARLAILLALVAYSVMSHMEMSDVKTTGVSIRVLLLVSFFIGFMAVKELFSIPVRRYLTAAGMLVWALLISLEGKAFWVLGFFCGFEFLSLFPKLDHKWYFALLIGVFVETPAALPLRLVLILMLAILYVQHNYVVADYRRRMKEDVLTEQSLKRDMREREVATKAELARSALIAENQILEERAALSQTLHDKLGHNINGSVYQLEAVKVLMEKDPERATAMVQAVIDQLRTGMDEIRAILRKERPEKKDLALLQLYKLCEDCNNKGVETEFEKEGDIAQIPDTLWEVILDNAYEAVSNAMKYARCTRIDIRIVIMNRMVRCSIRDNGIGCKEVKDGMGISGMRQRVRTAGGTIDLETEAGFTVNMLLPIN
ncbi:MAG: hypothetical protein K5897_03005 [Eubacterium sp.]|nr:hypothetical protein [Eubacterium sp.]